MPNDLLQEAEQIGFESLFNCKTLACSQAVLLAVQSTFGPKDPLLIKAVSPMAGGSRVGSLCGALQGGILSLGMHYGTREEKMNNKEALMASYEPVMRLYRSFENAFGSRYCPQIIQADLADEEQRKKWLDKGGWQKCALLCGQTARMVGKILIEHNKL